MASPLNPESEVRKVDPSGRISVGKSRAGDQFQVVEMEDGTIVLTPVTFIPTSELWLHRNPKAKSDLEEALKESAEGRVAEMGDLSRYLADSDDEE
jgi:hypothetical protein